MKGSLKKFLSMIKKHKKTKMLTIFGIAMVLVTLIGATYAYFSQEAAANQSVNAIVTTQSDESIDITIDKDLVLSVSDNNLLEKW